MSTKIPKPSSGRTRPSEAAKVEPVTVGDSQGWRITHGGRHRTVLTSSSSAAAIEEASQIYSDALKRLATR